MKARLYLETSVISYLTARPSRDLMVAAHQEITREWSERHRQKFDILSPRWFGKKQRKATAKQ